MHPSCGNCFKTQLGLNMSTSKPAVIPKRMSWVRVRFWLLSPWHTVYLCRGVTGIHGFIIVW
jgi:hypothetical protein